jgi:hypothetical protein
VDLSDFTAAAFLYRQAAILSFIGVEPSGIIRNMRGSCSHCPILHQPSTFHLKEEEMEQWLTFVTCFFWDTIVSACTCDEVI